MREGDREAVVGVPCTEYDKIYEPTPNEGPIFFLTDDNWAEVDSLACNMETIERYTGSTTPSSRERTRISRASRIALT